MPRRAPIKTLEQYAEYFESSGCDFVYYDGGGAYWTRPDGEQVYAPYPSGKYSYELREIHAFWREYMQDCL